MYAHILTVFLLTSFILVTTKSLVYDEHPKTGKLVFNFRSFLFVTSIITGIWYFLYLFFSKDTGSIVDNIDEGEDIFE